MAFDLVATRVLCTGVFAVSLAGQHEAVSPDKSKLASIGGLTRITIRNTSGHQKFARTIAVPKPCQLPYLKWLDPRVLLIQCKINPSVGLYQEVDVITGKTLLSGLGSGFERSPNGQHLVHAGWVPHFSSPYEKSDYLTIDGEDVYPRRPAKTDEELNFARRVGDRYVNIHDFAQSWVWSPDSRLVALVDREFDWQLDTTGESGQEVDQRYYLVVVGRQAPARRVKIDDHHEVRWIDNQTIEIRKSGSIKVFRIADLKP